MPPKKASGEASKENSVEDLRRHPPKAAADTDPKRPTLPKFATIHPDKYPDIRQDLPLNHFDRNLTVEKAHFETHASDFDLDECDLLQASPPCGSPPLLSSASTTSNAPSSNSPSNFSKAQPTKSRSDSDKTVRTEKKRRRPPHVTPSSATPTEVFHRNLIDAVSNVDDSDENEQYVYPYNSSHSDSSRHLNAKTRSWSVVSIPTLPSQQRKLSAVMDYFRRNKSVPKDDAPSPSYRPRMRTNLDPTHPLQLDTSVHLFKKFDPDTATSPLALPKSTVASRYIGDETMPLLWTERLTPKSKPWFHALKRWIIACIFLCFVLFALAAYSARRLSDVSVSMGRVLASDKELIFDLRVAALNPNWWTVQIAEADISVFAFSQVVPSLHSSNMSVQHEKGVNPAEYLGSYHLFDEPLTFSSSVFTGTISHAVTQIRIKAPGLDKSGNERWSHIIRYPYGLVTRGVLKYCPFFCLGGHRQSTAVCDVTRVDPKTGIVSDSPDQSYCST